MAFMEKPCKSCGRPIVMTAYGWGHLSNPTFAHHAAKPRTARAAQDRPLTPSRSLRQGIASPPAQPEPPEYRPRRLGRLTQ